MTHKGINMLSWLQKSILKTNAKPATGTSSLRTYSPKSARQLDGARAEELALAHLRQHGLDIIDANVACVQGEIDLIMRERQTLVFVEVRWRKTAAFGGATASVTPHKIAKLSRACEMFLQHNPKWRSHPCRIDVVALQGELDAPSIEWLQNITG